MSEETAYDQPGRGAGDVAHSVVRAGLSAIPFAGGAAAELFNLVIVPPLEKRRDEWINSIVDGLKSLEAEVDSFRLENLSDNESFITCLMQASQAAIRNHQDEKLEALRNAVLNAALPNAPEDDLQLMFLNYVDSLTTWHLRVLSFFSNPREQGEKLGIAYPTWSMGAPSTVLEYTFSELRGQREFYDQVVKDLFTRGLMNTESLHTTMTEQGMFASRTTAAGQRFIAFITSPLSIQD